MTVLEYCSLIQGIIQLDLRGYFLNVHDSTPNSSVKPALRGSGDKDDLWCDYCKKPRHTREKCSKQHGKPQNGQKGNSNKAFQGTALIGIKGATEEKVNTASTLEKPPFTEEQLDLLVVKFASSLDESKGT